jgi:glutathione S-transferase
VPVIRIDDKDSLFESNAINEYLDETVEPRLHPADPLQRAVNRAWTDYVPTFASSVTGCAYAATEEAYKAAIAKIPEAFGRLEKALETQGSDPFFNGKTYSLVDAAYAPFLQRYFFLDGIRKIGEIEKYPRLNAWAKALMARPSTHSFPEAEFEAMYRAGLQKRGSYLSQFVEPARAAAE